MILQIHDELLFECPGSEIEEIIKLIKYEMESAIELIRGTYGLPSNPHAWYSKGMRTMKHWNALTMLTGFMAAAPDDARVLMTSGLQRGFKSQFEVFTKGFSNGLFNCL